MVHQHCFIQTETLLVAHVLKSRANVFYIGGQTVRCVCSRTSLVEECDEENTVFASPTFTISCFVGGYHWSRRFVQKLSPTRVTVLLARTNSAQIFMQRTLCSGESVRQVRCVLAVFFQKPLAKLITSNVRKDIWFIARMIRMRLLIPTAPDKEWLKYP